MSDIQELLTAVRAREDRIDQQIAELRGMTGLGPRSRDGGNAEVHVNAGGVGVAISVGCAAFALACLMFAMLLQFDMGRKIERAQDYQNMLWQRYPELRPENLKQKEEKVSSRPR